MMKDLRNRGIQLGGCDFAALFRGAREVKMKRNLMLTGVIIAIGMMGCSGSADYQPRDSEQGVENGQKIGAAGDRTESGGGGIDDVLELKGFLKQINVALGGDLGDDPDPEDVLRRAKDSVGIKKKYAGHFDDLKKQLKIDGKTSSGDTVKKAKEIVKVLNDVKSVLGGSGSSGPSTDPVKDVRDLMSERDGLEREKNAAMTSLTAYLGPGAAPTSVLAGVGILTSDLTAVGHVVGGTNRVDFSDATTKLGTRVADVAFDAFAAIRIALGDGNTPAALATKAGEVTADLTAVAGVLGGTTALDNAGNRPGAGAQAQDAFDKFRAIRTALGNVGDVPGALATEAGNLKTEHTAAALDLTNVEHVLKGTGDVNFSDDRTKKGTTQSDAAFDKFVAIRAALGNMGTKPSELVNEVNNLKASFDGAAADLENVGKLLLGTTKLNSGRPGTTQAGAVFDKFVAIRAKLGSVGDDPGALATRAEAVVTNLTTATTDLKSMEDQRNQARDSLGEANAKLAVGGVGFDKNDSTKYQGFVTAVENTQSQATVMAETLTAINDELHGDRKVPDFEPLNLNKRDDLVTAAQSLEQAVNNGGTTDQATCFAYLGRINNKLLPVGKKIDPFDASEGDNRNTLETNVEAVAAALAKGKSIFDGLNNKLEDWDAGKKQAPFSVYDDNNMDTINGHLEDAIDAAAGN
ncbi:MAG: hypothetical protein AAF471_03090 [Myxococcota bacterium]